MPYIYKRLLLWVFCIRLISRSSHSSYMSRLPQLSLSDLLAKTKLYYDRRSAGQSVLEQSTHLGLMARSWLLSDSCGFVGLGRPLWREDGSAVCNCCWPLSARSFSGPSPLGLRTPWGLPTVRRRNKFHFFKENTRIWQNHGSLEHCQAPSQNQKHHQLTQLIDSMKLSPSWEAASCAAIQKFTQYFMEPEGSLSCSQEPSTGQYPEPHRSSPYNPILSKIRFNITHLRLGPL
jgi:hypothetical protein